MSQRILILGGDGMLGHKIFQTFIERFDTACTIRGQVSDDRHCRIDLFQTGNVIENVDAMAIDRVEALLVEQRPDVVVNCVGIIKQRTEAHASIPSITINSLLPHRLALALEPWGGRLIHFSTDCVFSGRRGSYTEEDLSDAQDLYGKSKYLGEVVAGNALTLRTSIIGRELHNFASLLEWFLSQNHRSVKGFTRAIYSGVTTNHLASIVADLIENHSGLSGLYQVASQPISKYDLLTLVREAFRLDIEVHPSEAYPLDRSMVGERFAKATGYVCPPWTNLVAELAADRTPYERWR